MRKFITIASLVVGGVFLAVSNTQAQTSTTDQVNVTLEFNDVMSLSVNSNQSDVKLIYNSMDDYLNGVESRQDKHLTVFSINPFQVKVAAQNNNQFGTSGFETESIQIEAVGFEDVTGVIEQTAVNVGAEAKPVFKSNNYTDGGTVDINYSTKGTPGLKGQAVGEHVGESYTKTFVYSIEPL